jgi:F-type H+-transporting ATPase subunit epsilon
MTNDGGLVLQIITPDGRSLKESQIDVIVLRRREKRFDVGSEVAIFLHHAPTLIRLPVASLRYRRGRRTSYLAVGGGFAEIKEDRVLIVTPRFAVVRPDEPGPSARARRIAEQWRQESKDFQREMAGYP